MVYSKYDYIKRNSIKFVILNIFHYRIIWVIKEFINYLKKFHILGIIHELFSYNIVGGENNADIKTN